MEELRQKNPDLFQRLCNELDKDGGLEYNTEQELDSWLGRRSPGDLDDLLEEIKTFLQTQ